MGNGIVQRLKETWNLEDEWVSYEIHPETPPEGVPLSERFPASSLEGMYANLRRAGAPYGVEFGEHRILSNSRQALEASEYARDEGHFHPFHSAVFRAYFSEGKDIGDRAVLRTIAKSVGLDPAGLDRALDSHRYAERLAQAQEEGAAYRITGTPTFIINRKYKIVGAQPFEVFQQAFTQIAAEQA